MSDGVADTVRRFLLTGVYSHYHFEPTWDRPELADDLTTMVALFTGEFGYTHVPLLGLDATWLQTKDALRDFATSPDRRPDDYVVLYLAGHGEVIPVGQTGVEHILLPSDATGIDLRRRAVKSADLAEWLLADTEIRRLLLIVDACYSGHGALDFASSALASLGRPHRFDGEDSGGTGVIVITASRPAERAVAGAFTAGFARAVRHQATAGHGPEDLSIDAVLSVLRADPAVPASQTATWSLLLGEGSIPYFLPNPRREASLVPLDLAEQARQWQARLVEEHKRADELRTRFLPKSAGFLGRTAALTRLTSWLRDQSQTDSVMVTGNPGSGKTAVLGLLAALSDESQRPTVSTSGITGADLPDPGAIDAAVYAGGLTTTAVLTGIAAAAGMPQLDPDPAALDEYVVRLLAALAERPGLLTVLIDALDEADDPTQLVETVIRPLTGRGIGKVRFLLATRREILDRFGRNWQRQYGLVDLDSPDYSDQGSISVLIRRTLLGQVQTAGASAEESPFATAEPNVLDGVVTAVAEVARSSFFVATIVAATQARLALTNGLPDHHDRAWLDSLPRQSGEAMRDDLRTRLGDRFRDAMELLLPLAYARGVGLPWEDIWVLLANALHHGRAYTNDDLAWLRYRAGSYVVEGGVVESRSLYRLFHQSLADYMRGGRDRNADETIIFRALRDHVPSRPDGRPNWQAAHPYLRLHLAQHAETAGLADELTTDPGYLAVADQAHLLAALDHSVSDAAQTVAAAYRRAAPALRRYPKKDHISYLGLAARYVGAKDLAAHADAEDQDGSWSPRWASWRQNRHHQRLDGHTGWVNALVPAGPLLVSASDDATVRLWDLTLGTEARSPLLGHVGAVNIVVAADDGGGRYSCPPATTPPSVSGTPPTAPP
ncbi:caspase family protein [Dactylosporangium cerinum]